MLQTEREVRYGISEVGALGEAVLNRAKGHIETERHKLAVRGINGIGQVE